MTTEISALPDFTLGVIGHHAHGKTTLTAAMLRYATARFGRPGEDSVLELPPKASEVQAYERVRCYQFRTGHRSYGHLDIPGSRGRIRATGRALGQVDGAILVVDVTRSAEAQTREHLVLARAAGVEQVVVFLNRCDEASDPGWIDEVEREVRLLLVESGYEGDDVPFVRGSALRAYEGVAAWQGSMDRLFDVFDQELRDPHRRDDLPPRMAIEEVTSSRAGGTIVLGRVEQGVLRTEKMCLVGRGAAVIPVRIARIERFHQSLTEVRAGTFVGVSFEADKGGYRVLTGMTLLKPESAVTHRKIEVKLRVIPLREWGRHTPIKSGHKGFLHVGAVGVAAALQLPAETLTLTPGDEIEGVRVTLEWPVWLEVGQHFMFRDGTDGYRQLKYPKPVYTGKRYINDGDPMMAGMAIVGAITAILQE